MREILFRAKAINRSEERSYRTSYKNGDWVYGLIDRPYEKDFPRLPMTMRNEEGVTNIDVDYKTIGQFTGLTDKNGSKIFEGDIVKTKEGVLQVVVYNISLRFNNISYNAGWCCKMKNNEYWHIDNTDEVIGNIHDNPELLEVGK